MKSSKKTFSLEDVIITTLPLMYKTHLLVVSSLFDIPHDHTSLLIDLLMMLLKMDSCAPANVALVL